ncbi:MAG: molecular chaperone DnaJ [Patescibacteria group bacterium]
MSKDYYKILGVDKKASKDEIKKAFHKLAHKYHPDKKDGDETKFKEASEAYSVLSDERKRQEYDTYGQAFGGNGGPQGGFGGFSSQGGPWDFSGFQQGAGGFEFDLGDIFGDLFGGGRKRTKRGSDISIDVEIPFAESIFGTERKIKLTKNMKCEACGGTGAKKGTKMQTCSACGGKGKIHETKQSFMGSFSMVRTCEKCDGKGEIPEEKCDVCKGHGIVRKQEEIKIGIPAGINNGEMIRLTGGGEMIADGVAGDLYIKVHVIPHKEIKKNGDDLEMNLSVKLSDALLGTEYLIETLDGKLEVTIPKGIDNNEILKIKNKGVPVDSRNRGDLLLKVKVKLPTKLSRRAKKLIEDLREEGI